MTRLLINIIFAMGFALIPPTTVFAQSSDAVAAFREVVQSLTSGEATFEQVVSDKNGKPTSRTTGTLQFAKPGKFKWVYAAPMKQQIIGNGKKVWMFDEDLKQVTVRPQDKAINAGPAAIFAGQAELDAAFSMRAIGELDGLQWVEALPKLKDTGFDKLRVGLKTSKPSDPVKLELYDNFGNTTTLTFKTFKRNAKVTDEVFNFVAPKGVDVLGE
jgi:outer membrane lipoprotein carrier protein